MSIESNIAELTAAVKELTAALKAGAPASADKVDTKPTKKVEEKKPAAAENASPQPGAEPPSTAAPAAQEPAAEAIPFKTVADAAIKLNTKDYASLAAICQAENVKKISGLAPERYAPVLEIINAKLAELDSLV